MPGTWRFNEKERQMNKRWLIGLSLLVALSLLIGGCQNQPPTAEEIVTRLKEVEAGIEDAHAVLEVQGMDNDMVVEVWEKRPNKFRAEVLEASDADDVGAVQVTDGQQVWIYKPGKNEVLVGEVGPDEPASFREAIQSMEEVIQEVLDTSEVKSAGEEEVAGVATYKLELTPREGEKAPLPGKVTLWVDQERWIVLQAHFSGGVAGEGWMRVRSFEFNIGLSDDPFQFEIPEGAEVVNMEDRQPKHITLEEAQEQAEFTLLVPTYLPEGVTLIDVLAVDEAFIFRYDHSTTSFTVVQGFAGDRMAPPAGAQTTEVTVRGQTATLISDETGDNNFLTWTENEVDITIAGRIGHDEIIKIAESLQ
jgi:outer membrane lipoprotein-sorting protein